MRIQVDDPQQTNLAAVGEPFMHEIHCSNVVQFRSDDPLRSMNSGSLPVRHLSTQIEPLQGVKAIYALPIYVKAFASQKDMDARIAVTNPDSCNFLDASDDPLCQYEWSPDLAG